MSKFCSKCGTEIEEDGAFCPNCGNKTDESINVNVNINQNAPIIAKRDIVVAVILSIVTCGIYGIYWFVVMTDESNRVSGDNTTSGGMALLLTIVTCGIYSIYWNYKMGKKMYEAGKKYNKDISDNSILYLILSLIGFSIISYCLIQSDLNKFSE